MPTPDNRTNKRYAGRNTCRYDLPCPKACRQVSTAIHELSEALGTAIDAKDAHTKSHSDEVAVISQAIALALGLSPEAADHIHIAGHLHDIGKIGVPDRVLLKTGSLDPEEWRYIRAHPEIGADILRPVRLLADTGIPEMILHHHERFDGTGYPRGLAGERIPLGARIITVADSLSAMLQSRPYRPGMTFEEACREIRRCSGKQFDPAVVAAFADKQEHIRDILAGMCLAEPNSPLAFRLSA